MRTHCARCRRTRLRHRPRGPGRRRRYCRACRLFRDIVNSEKARRKRRAKAKDLGVPTWKRNGWKTHEQAKEYHRRYMKRYRADRRKLAA